VLTFFFCCSVYIRGAWRGKYPFYYSGQSIVSYFILVLRVGHTLCPSYATLGGSQKGCCVARYGHIEKLLTAPLVSLWKSRRTVSKIAVNFGINEEISVESKPPVAKKFLPLVTTDTNRFHVTSYRLSLSMTSYTSPYFSYSVHL
jgi:hypothetical protein